MINKQPLYLFRVSCDGCRKPLAPTRGTQATWPATWKKVTIPVAGFIAGGKHHTSITKLYCPECLADHDKKAENDGL